MSIGIKICIFAVLVLLAFDIYVIFRIFIERFKNTSKKVIFQRQRDVLLDAIAGKISSYKKKISAADYFKMKQSIQLDYSDKERIERLIDTVKIEKKFLKQLQSLSRIKRIEAATYLGLVGTEGARKALEEAILKEKDYSVRLYMANALSDIGHKESISVLVSTLIDANLWYRSKVNMLIADFGEAFHAYLPQIIESDRIEIKELIVDFASVYYSEMLKSYLIRLVDIMECEIKKLCDEDVRRKYKAFPASVAISESYRKLVYKAADVLACFYPQVIGNEKYLNSKDAGIRKAAVKALSNFDAGENFPKLIALLKDKEIARDAANSILNVIEKHPGFLNMVVKAFEEEKDFEVKQRLAEILSIKAEYFIMKLNTKNRVSSANILKQLLLFGKTSEIIDFLNKNKNIDIENELCNVIKEAIAVSTALKKEFSAYLNERLLNKCGLTRNEEGAHKREEKKDTKLIKALYILMVLTVLVFPAIYFIRHFDIVFTMPFIEQIKIYVVDFNYYLVFYAIAVNLVYIILLIFSYINVNQQEKLWKIKSMSLLFKKNMLPSISVIAPAYNEEKTIIESVNSLLNLKYPDYELIIVNDGSKDNTLDVLIKYFNLTRVDYIYDCKINTKPIRGVYMNKSMPKLIVVDKENGGKADSLNAGINISKKEYFCGIDADSLLEDDALLKIASLTLDTTIEMPALGGNIFPINGCRVERGMIKNFGIPRSRLARFQFIEYIRAFMAGRPGWAWINSLLIISGAFGLFRKERVIHAGGYLTSSGKYAKDTVGEDMELVVRISRLMLELREKYRICYAFNANCWTEVPEDIKSLKKQRYRWHRGLIDILYFHKKLLFNPQYKRVGLIAMPYFFLFEMVGPLIEVQGYVMVVAAFLLGLLNTEIALLLFVSNVLMGVFISLSSLLIAKKSMNYFKPKDIAVLIIYSILENFGLRQMLSLWRVGGYLNMLKKPEGWGKLERKGFSSANNAMKSK